MYYVNFFVLNYYFCAIHLFKNILAENFIGPKQDGHNMYQNLIVCMAFGRILKATLSWIRKVELE